jgi:hypothetical protein
LRKTLFNRTEFVTTEGGNILVTVTFDNKPSSGAVIINRRVVTVNQFQQHRKSIEHCGVSVNKFFSGSQQLQPEFCPEFTFVNQLVEMNNVTRIAYT